MTSIMTTTNESNDEPRPLRLLRWSSIQAHRRVADGANRLDPGEVKNYGFNSSLEGRDMIFD